MNERNYNRRKFIRASLLGSAAAVVGKNATASEYKYHEQYPVPSPKILTRKLGNTDLELPIVSMGVMRSDNPSLVRAALKKGIVHLDTAHVYQGGRNEEMLGRLLQDYPRDSYIIASKVKVDGFDRETGKYTEETNPDEIFEKLNISLERLGLDHVDILYLHAVQSYEGALYKPILKNLKKLKKMGKARYLGVSTHRNMPEVIEAVIDSKVYDVVLTSYNFQMKDDKKMENALKKAAGAGIGIVGMKTMAGGFLDKERTKKVNAKAALKWALQNENIHTTIPGFTSFDELEDSFSVMEDLTLTEQEKQDLKPDESSASLFCTGCESCVKSCKYKLNIPDYMRAYMYTYGYHEHKKAQDVLASQKTDAARTCEECNTCTATCPKGFQVAERIRDISRLTDVPHEFFT